MKDPDPILIDLNEFESAAPSKETPPTDGKELEPDHSLGFTLTPMEPSKQQRKPTNSGLPAAPPELLGQLVSHRVTVLQPHPLAWQAENDQFHIGGPAAPLTEEVIDYNKDVYRRPSAIVTFSTNYFTEYPDTRVVLELGSSTRTPSDGWIQFFFGNKMVGKIFIGGERRTYLQEFRFTGTRLPYESYHLIARLAAEENVDKWGYFLFNRAQIRVYEPQAAEK